MILLNSDVAWFCPRPSNLVLLLKNNSCETSTSGGVAKNVSDIVVTKQQRRPMVTASRVISEHVHLCIASFSLVAACGARKRCVKKWHSQPKLQRCGEGDWSDEGLPNARRGPFDAHEHSHARLCVQESPPYRCLGSVSIAWSRHLATTARGQTRGSLHPSRVHGDFCPWSHSSVACSLQCHLRNCAVSGTKEQ